MRQERRLGDFEPTQPQDVGAQSDVESAEMRADKRRLMREVKHRLASQNGGSTSSQSLSKVEKVMRRNAPDLMPLSSPDRDRQAAEVDSDVRWPRPRLLALIVVITLAAVVPSVTMRLLIWMVIMLLLTAVMLGPERARDGVHFAAGQMARSWDREIGFFRRVFGWFGQ